MSFANETPLEDVLRYIKAATQGPTDSGIPVYVDPVALQETKHSLRSPVALDVEGVPLRTTLFLLLKQLGLDYEVRDGVLRIGKASATDPFHWIGQCYAALLAAMIGGVAGRAFFNRQVQVTT
jgi:hypothetical protein